MYQCFLLTYFLWATLGHSSNDDEMIVKNEENFFWWYDGWKKWSWRMIRWMIRWWMQEMEMRNDKMNDAWNGLMHVIFFGDMVGEKWWWKMDMVDGDMVGENGWTNYAPRPHTTDSYWVYQCEATIAQSSLGNCIFIKRLAISQWMHGLVLLCIRVKVCRLVV